MPTEVFEETWQHAWNVAPANNSSNAELSASWIFFMHQLVLGLLSFTDINNAAIGSPAGVWTVAGSSDAVTGAMDGVDRLGSTFNFAKYVSATTGNPHTWICYKSPTTGFGPGIYYLFDYANASGVNFINLYISKTAPTGGSNTTKPTTTDAPAVLSVQINDGTFTPFVFSGVLSTTGEHFMFVQKTSAGQAQYFQWLTMFHDNKGPSGDVHPYGLYAEYSTNPPGCPSSTIFGTSQWRARFPDNTGTDGTTATSFGLGQPNVSGVGPVTSIFANTRDGVDGSVMDWPAGPFVSNNNNSTSHITKRGRPADLMVAGTDGTNGYNGETYPPSSPPVTPPVTSAVMGVFWVPCNQTPTL